MGNSINYISQLRSNVIPSKLEKGRAKIMRNASKGDLTGTIFGLTFTKVLKEKAETMSAFGKMQSV